MQQAEQIRPLNLAAFHPGTDALGPGKRFAMWVQGCPFSCKGCIAPDWIPIKAANQFDPHYFADLIMKIPGLDGITISGGEPMLQAQALAEMLERVHAQSDLNVIVFSGFRYETLLESPPNPFVPVFLKHIDVLIDGLYVEKLNNGKGLRGSTNQRFHFLTPRLKDFDFASLPRKVEVYLYEGEAFLVGVPNSQFLQAFQKAVEDTQKKLG